METDIPATEPRTQHRTNYTVFDRKLISAKREQREVTIVLTKATFDPLSQEWLSLITTKIVSVDTYFIEVFCIEANRNVWLNKRNIASATIDNDE